MKDTMCLMELRSILFDVENQKMTVEELRTAIFVNLGSQTQLSKDEMGFALDAITQEEPKFKPYFEKSKGKGR